MTIQEVLDTADWRAVAQLLVRIDGQRCEGHAICFLVAPGVFGVDDDGRGTVINPFVASEHSEIVRAAMDRCREHAIVVEQRPRSQ